jgi:hypothetical protein
VTTPRAVLLTAALAGCGGGHSAPRTDASTGCTADPDCSAPTPTCDLATHTCVECRFSSQCSGDKRICEANACRVAHGCQELSSELPGLPAGVYTVDLDGAGAQPPISAYCEITAGGGWTLIQRTLWSWTQSQGLIGDFPAWLNDPIGAPGAGNAYRMPGAAWPTLAAKGDVLLVVKLHTTAGGACSALDYVGTGGVMTVDMPSSAAHFTGVTQPVSIINGPDLSTSTTGPYTTCVTSGQGAPWFYAGCCSTCPTYMGGYWTDSPHPMVPFTTVADFYGHTEIDACAGQSPIHDSAGSSFRGVDTMEVYLR